MRKLRLKHRVKGLGKDIIELAATLIIYVAVIRDPDLRIKIERF